MTQRQPSLWSQLADPHDGLPAGRMRIAVRPLLVVAHADDETISASAILSRLSDPVVVFLTDGAPHDPRLWSPDAIGSREDYAEMRRKEAVEALGIVGIPGERIFWLGAVDQDAIFEVAALVKKLREILRDHHPDVVITPSYEGGHPDHDAAALVSALATRSSNSESAVASELLEVPLYHNQAGHCVTGEFLPSAWEGTGSPVQLTLSLSAEEIAAKQQMVRCHHSQRLVLQGFALHTERLRPAPLYDFTQPPHPGKLWYECLGWPMTGQRWRELAAEAVAEGRGRTCH